LLNPTSSGQPTIWRMVRALMIVEVGFAKGDRLRAESVRTFVALR
jgi:hypothetical protein